MPEKAKDIVDTRMWFNRIKLHITHGKKHVHACIMHAVHVLHQTP